MLALSCISHHASHPWDSELDEAGSEGLAADADAEDWFSGMLANEGIPGKVGGGCWKARWLAITRADDSQAKHPVLPLHLSMLAGNP